jgi:hypothetical protein
MAILDGVAKLRRYTQSSYQRSAESPSSVGQVSLGQAGRFFVAGVSRENVLNTLPIQGARFAPNTERRPAFMRFASERRLSAGAVQLGV